MSVYFIVEYGFEPQTADSAHLAWKEREQATERHVAQASFDFFKRNRPVRGEVSANIIHLFLMSFDGRTELIVTQIAWHLYRDDYALTLEDRPHIDLKGARPVRVIKNEVCSGEGFMTMRTVASVPGVWIVLETSSETGEQSIVGVARTTGGVQKLMDIVCPVMDDTREVTVKYFSFIEGE